MLGVLAAVVLGFTLPMSPAQILWVNLITCVTLGLVLAFEPAEPGVMQRPPRRPDAPLLSPFMLWRTVLVSLLKAAVTLALLFQLPARGRSLEETRTLVVIALVAMEVGYLFSVRYLRSRSFTWQGALGTAPVLWALGGLAAAQGLFTCLPVMNVLFETAPLGPADLLLTAAAGAGLMALLEAEKAAFRRLDVARWLPDG